MWTRGLNTTRLAYMREVVGQALWKVRESNEKVFEILKASKLLENSQEANSVTPYREQWWDTGHKNTSISPSVEVCYCC